MRILYVEDDKNIRRSAEMLMTCFPKYEFVAVEDYKSAITELNQKPFDIIISDFQYAGRNDDKLNLRGHGGPDLLEYVSKEKIDALFAFLSGTNPEIILTTLAARGLTLAENLIFDKGGEPIISVIKSLETKAVPARTPGPIAVARTVEENFGD